MSPDHSLIVIISAMLFAACAALSGRRNVVADTLGLLLGIGAMLVLLLLVVVQ